VLFRFLISDTVTVLLFAFAISTQRRATDVPLSEQIFVSFFSVVFLKARK
jgi:hypothetical protein